VIRRNLSDLRIVVRNRLLVDEPEERRQLRAEFEAGRVESAATLPPTRTASFPTTATAPAQRIPRPGPAMARGRQPRDRHGRAGPGRGGTHLPDRPLNRVGQRLVLTSQAWIEHHERLATAAGRDMVRSSEDAQAHFVVAIALVLLLSALLGSVVFRSIVHPIRALEGAVKRVAEGDFEVHIPFAKARDETGALARSIACSRPARRR
jgi:HAMP domain-containing protein